MGIFEFRVCVFDSIAQLCARSEHDDCDCFVKGKGRAFRISLSTYCHRGKYRSYRQFSKHLVGNSLIFLGKTTCRQLFLNLYDSACSKTWPGIIGLVWSWNWSGPEIGLKIGLVWKLVWSQIWSQNWSVSKFQKFGCTLLWAGLNWWERCKLTV